MKKIKNAYIKIKKQCLCFCLRRKLKYKDFSIISNNCWGGLIYQKFGLRYSSPTIGLFILDEDYLKFVERLDYYLSLPLNFIEPRNSKNYNLLYKERNQEITYPVARLGDIEVFFMHYNSEKEAERKWKYRISRINHNRLLVKFSQRDSESKEILKRFEDIPLNNKICFTPLDYKSQKCNFVQVEALKKLNIQGGDETPYTLDAVDICDVINKMR